MASRKIPPSKSRKAPPAKARSPIPSPAKLRGPKRPGPKRILREPEPATTTARVRRHRQELRKKGMRPITLWVPDTRSPEFAAAAAEACRRANEADKTDPVVKFFDELVEESFRDLDEHGL